MNLGERYGLLVAPYGSDAIYVHAAYSGNLFALLCFGFYPPQPSGNKKFNVFLNLQCFQSAVILKWELKMCIKQVDVKHQM